MYCARDIAFYGETSISDGLEGRNLLCLLAWNLGALDCIVGYRKPMSLSNRVDYCDLDDVATVHIHNRPCLPQMMQTIIVAVVVSNYCKVARRTSDSRTWRAWDPDGVGHCSTT
jgi:hypothetical protein